MNWKIVQSCVPGKKHEMSVCEDNCAYFEDKQLKVMALCDGTSDAEFSNLGSKWVADFSVTYMQKHFDEMYDAKFSKICELITSYHQQLLLYLSQCAEEEKGKSIVINRQINNKELRKYCSTLQVVAKKKEQGIYFKVGNGSAIIVEKNKTEILSDSSTESPTKHVTMPNTLTVLSSCEFKRFVVDVDSYAVILMTDGVEYEKGMFYNHAIKPEFNELLELIQNSSFDKEKLKKFILKLKGSVYNTAEDDIGISIMYQTLEMADDVGKISEANNRWDASYNRKSSTIDSSANVEISKIPHRDTRSDSVHLDTAENPVYKDNTFIKKKTNADIKTESEENQYYFENTKNLKRNSRTTIRNGRLNSKKVIIYLLSAFIAGIIIGSFIITFSLAGKIDKLDTQIEQLTDEILY